MTCQVILKHTAEKELDALQTNMRERILKRLLALEDNPRPAGIKRLQGQESYRLRVRDYRVLHTIDAKAKQVFILAVGHRGDVYC